MKKRLLLMLALVIMTSMIMPQGVFANEAVRKYIPKVKEIFEIGEEYKDIDIHNRPYRKDDIYDISFMSNDYDINVGIDYDGNIVRYGKHSMRDREEPLKFPKISEEEASKKAKNILTKINPNLFKNAKMNNVRMRGNLDTYYFMYVRNENDIDFNHNTASVEVDSYTGEVTNVYIEWDENIKLANKDNIISEEEAYELFKADQDVELIYILDIQDDKLEGSYRYTIGDRARAIDAKTGENIENLNNFNDYGYYGFLIGNEKKVSIEEENRLVNAGKVVSREEAAKELRSFADLDKSYTIQGSNLVKNKTDESYVWEIQINKQEGNSGFGTTVSVDAIKNQVLNFHKFDMRQEEKFEAKYSLDQASEIAKAFLQKKMPDKYKKVEYVGNIFYDYEGDISEYIFRFNRVIDGVKLPQNGFTISVSSLTGEVMNYNYLWNDIEPLSKEGMIGQDKAKEILLNNRKLDLKYILDKDSIKNKKKEVKLVYCLSDEENIFIDAMTGKKISQESIYNLDDKKEETYKDIDKSYAKAEIEKLRENGIYLEGENFYPKKDISQMDFLYLLSNTKRYMFPYEEEYIYERASRDGVIKPGEKNPDKQITRGQAIKYIVRSFGQEDAANLGDIYKTNYKDIDNSSKELKGYIAVAEGLGLISGEGNFRPNDNLTRQEAAIMIYNILDRD